MTPCRLLLPGELLLCDTGPGGVPEARKVCLPSLYERFLLYAQTSSWSLSEKVSQHLYLPHSMQRNLQRVVIRTGSMTTLLCRARIAAARERAALVSGDLERGQPAALAEEPRVGLFKFWDTDSMQLDPSLAADNPFWADWRSAAQISAQNEAKMRCAAVLCQK